MSFDHEAFYNAKKELAKRYGAGDDFSIISEVIAAEEERQKGDLDQNADSESKQFVSLSSRQATVFAAFTAITAGLAASIASLFITQTIRSENERLPDRIMEASQKQNQLPSQSIAARSNETISKGRSNAELIVLNSIAWNIRRENIVPLLAPPDQVALLSGKAEDLGIILNIQTATAVAASTMRNQVVSFVSFPSHQYAALEIDEKEQGRRVPGSNPKLIERDLPRALRAIRGFDAGNSHIDSACSMFYSLKLENGGIAESLEQPSIKAIQDELEKIWHDKSTEDAYYKIAGEIARVADRIFWSQLEIMRIQEEKKREKDQTAGLTADIIALTNFCEVTLKLQEAAQKESNLTRLWGTARVNAVAGNDAQENEQSPNESELNTDERNTPQVLAALRELAYGYAAEAIALFDTEISSDQYPKDGKSRSNLQKAVEFYHTAADVRLNEKNSLGTENALIWLLRSAFLTRQWKSVFNDDLDSWSLNVRKSYRETLPGVYGDMVYSSSAQEAGENSDNAEAELLFPYRDSFDYERLNPRFGYMLEGYAWERSGWALEELGDLTGSKRCFSRSRTRFSLQQVEAPTLSNAYSLAYAMQAEGKASALMAVDHLMAEVIGFDDGRRDMEWIKREYEHAQDEFRLAGNGLESAIELFSRTPAQEEEKSIDSRARLLNSSERLLAVQWMRGTMPSDEYYLEALETIENEIRDGRIQKGREIELLVLLAIGLVRDPGSARRYLAESEGKLKELQLESDKDIASEVLSIADELIEFFEDESKEAECEKIAFRLAKPKSNIAAAEHKAVRDTRYLAFMVVMNRLAEIKGWKSTAETGL